MRSTRNSSSEARWKAVIPASGDVRWTCIDTHAFQFPRRTPESPSPKRTRDAAMSHHRLSLAWILTVLIACLANDIAVQRRAREGAQRPTRPSRLRRRVGRRTDTLHGADHSTSMAPGTISVGGGVEPLEEVTSRLQRRGCRYGKAYLEQWLDLGVTCTVFGKRSDSVRLHLTRETSSLPAAPDLPSLVEERQRVR